MAVLVSLSIIVGTLFVGDFLRNWLSKFKSSLLTKLILDSILTIELVTAALEFGVIFQHFGILWWTAGLFMNCVYQITRWSGLTPPSPYVHLLEWIQGKQSLIELLIRVSTLMAVGLLTYKFYVTKLWDYGLSELHLRRSVETSLDSCVTPWGDVPLVSAFTAEFIGTCFLVIVLQLVADNPTLANNDPKYSTMINATIICVAIHSALSLSGGMYNPMLATVLFGGCKGHEWTDHVLIYWIGSTFGALVASSIYPTIQKRIYPEDEKKMK